VESNVRENHQILTQSIEAIHYSTPNIKQERGGERLGDIERNIQDGEVKGRNEIRCEHWKIC